MKLNLPFFNRKRYIVLKCYTDNRLAYEDAPIILSNKLPALKNKEYTDQKPARYQNRTFNSCYGHIKTLQNSATIVAPCAFQVDVGADHGVSFQFAHEPKDAKSVDFNHNRDPFYHPLLINNETILVKQDTHWFVEEATGVPFVFASHIRNASQMRIISSIINFKHQHSTVIFNLVSKHQHSYVVEYKTPLVGLYPMSELPLHVECEWDLEKLAILKNRTACKPYFRGSVLKLAKENP